MGLTVKRPDVRATVHDETGELHSEVTHAWNSAIRAAEHAVRTIARQEGQMYSRGPAAGRTSRYKDQQGDTRSTVWTGDRTGRVLVATVEML